jgi:hypothetical protein
MLLTESACAKLQSEQLLQVSRMAIRELRDTSRKTRELAEATRAVLHSIPRHTIT